MGNEEKRTTQEAIFSILFKDVDETVKKIDKLKTEFPAAVQQTIEKITEKTNVNFQNLNNSLHEIRPQINEALALNTRNAEILVGNIVDASKVLQGAADKVTKDTMSVVTLTAQETINNAIDNAVKDAFEKAFATNITKLNNEITKLEIRAGKIVEGAENLTEVSTSMMMTGSLVSGLAGALIVALIMIAALKFDFITLPTPAVSLDAKAVAALIKEDLPIKKR